MSTTNPIITGFNPDPSIVRVGDDYYIATSTFEWFPGVQIHHSKDLVHWTLIHRPLDDLNKLDIKGIPDSCGVWAPCLTHHEGIFYLIYSQVKSFDGMYKDTPNYLVTAKDIMGPWSDPTFIDSSGFDGSLFHDDNGKKYYLSMLVDHRKGLFFGGIILQEYSPEEQKLIGPKHHIYKGSELGITEGPHNYKKDGYYYLLTAEGGTEYGHAVSVARSKALLGPYETHPHNPLISSKDDLQHPLQKTGHGDLVWTPSGECYLVFLTGRPLSPRGRCTLGRETAIEQIIWKNDGWPYCASGDGRARLSIPSLPIRSEALYIDQMTCHEEVLNKNYQSLRIPMTSAWASLSERKGFLRLYGQDGLSSTFRQSLLARRVQHFNLEYTVTVDFQPESFQQLAGLVCYYNTGHYIYLNISGDENDGCRYLNLIMCNNYEYSEEIEAPIMLSTSLEVDLKAVWRRDQVTFFYKYQDSDWQQIGQPVDASILSDDYVRDGSDRYRPAFTGSFIGIACQDLTGGKHYADFRNCVYKELIHE